MENSVTHEQEVEEESVTHQNRWRTSWGIPVNHGLSVLGLHSDITWARVQPVLACWALQLKPLSTCTVSPIRSMALCGVQLQKRIIIMGNMTNDANHFLHLLITHLCPLRLMDRRDQATVCPVHAVLTRACGRSTVCPVHAILTRACGRSSQAQLSAGDGTANPVTLRAGTAKPRHAQGWHIRPLSRSGLAQPNPVTLRAGTANPVTLRAGTANPCHAQGWHSQTPVMLRAGTANPVTLRAGTARP
ncbi:hypothetical protein JZ751_017245, partial [Albula glossodonta]